MSWRLVKVPTSMRYIFSESFYDEKEFTLYLDKSKTKENPTETTRNLKNLYSVPIKEINKIEERSLLTRFMFLQIKPGIRARQTLSGGLELKVNPGEGKPFELFNLSKEEYKTLKNYTALQQDIK